MSLLMLFRPFRWWNTTGAPAEIFPAAHRAKKILASERKPRRAEPRTNLILSGTRKPLIFDSE